MFAEISWQQYFLFIIIANFIYYAFIWIVFYKGKLPFLAGLGRIQTQGLYGEDQPDEVLSTAQHIIEELKPVFSNKKNKNELILGLQSKLRPYSNWEEPGFRETINQYIAEQGESVCSIHLSVSDLRAVWP